LIWRKIASASSRLTFVETWKPSPLRNWLPRKVSVSSLSFGASLALKNAARWRARSAVSPSRSLPRLSSANIAASTV
jgi:hypothetical protein